MSDASSPVCFHCGLATEAAGDEPRLNRLSDGRPCPVCADRLLEMLPSLVADVAAELHAVEQEDAEAQAEERPRPDEPA